MTQSCDVISCRASLYACVLLALQTVLGRALRRCCTPTHRPAGLHDAMGPYSVLGGLFAALLAAQIGMVYYVPEIEPFRSPVYLPPPLSPAPELLFKPAGPGLYKLELTQHITPFHAENLDLYLIHQAPSSWFLTDAGGFDTWLHPHASQIAQAVNNTIPAGHEFKYILRACRSGPDPSRLGISAQHVVAVHACLSCGQSVTRSVQLSGPQLMLSSFLYVPDISVS